MKNEFTALVEPGDDGWFAASCPEVPMAHGQGRTHEAAIEDLAACIEFVLEFLRDEAIEASPAARRSVVSVG